jgi:hypothetical protein
MAMYEPIAWNSGELDMQRLLHAPTHENPTAPFLTRNGSALLQVAPLLALGTLDDAGRPWSTLLGGEAGFSRAIGNSVIGIKTLVDGVYDPVVEALVGGKDRGSGEVTRQEKRLSALTIDLNSRKRVKIGGKTIAAALGELHDGIGEAQLVSGPNSVSR